MATYIRIFPKITPPLVCTLFLALVHTGQMLHYLPQKLKFEYIEKQEIIFYNVVVVLQDAFYKNENNL